MTESTTVKVSRETLKRLSTLQRSLHTKSMDETIAVLVKDRRRKLLDSVSGTDRDKSRAFREEDRLEDRS